MSGDRTGKKVVIKIGTGVLTRAPEGRLHHAIIARITEAIADLHASGHQCIVVSSGAVGAGLASFRLERRPEETAMLQACAAAGQASLMHLYETHFSYHRLKVAQLLLTHEDLLDDSRRTNVSQTLTALLRYPRIVPIINENDSVAVYELKVGDNDTLSAFVARLVHADLLVMLTSVPGLRGPHSTSEEDIIREVRSIDEVMDFAGEDKGAFSVGGMKSKLQAVKECVDAGIETIIASGKDPEQLPQLVGGEGIGTRFLPTTS